MKTIKLYILGYTERDIDSYNLMSHYYIMSTDKQSISIPEIKDNFQRMVCNRNKGKIYELNYIGDVIYKN